MAVLRSAPEGGIPRRVAILAALFLGIFVWGGLTPAWAAEDESKEAPADGDEAKGRPLLYPERDVDITYQAEIGGKMVGERVRWKAAERIERIDPLGELRHPLRALEHPYMLIDHRDNRVDVVDPRTKSVIEQVNTVAGELTELEAAHFAPLGEAKVAGFVCREWEAEISEADKRQVCITDDGVLLQVRKGDQVLLRATRIRYRKLAASYFEIPANYKAATSGNASPMPFYGSP